MGTNAIINKIIQIVIPIVLTALVGIIGFLVMQIIDLKSELGDMKAAMATNYGQLNATLGRQEVTVKNLAAKIDAITIVKIRGE